MTHELTSTINRIVSDLQKGKKLIQLSSGQFYFIAGKKLRLLEHPAINKLVEEKLLQQTYKFRGIRYYQLIPNVSIAAA